MDFDFWSVGAFSGPEFDENNTGCPPALIFQGRVVEKSLSTRTHICPHCGYTDCRDRNAALNILQKGLSMVGRTKPQASGD